MDPNDSNIFLSYISSGLAFLRRTLEGLFSRQSALPPTESVSPSNSLSPSAPSVSKMTLATSVASSVTSENLALPPVALSDNLVLPQTLMLRCFSYLDLKCLIFSRCVCSDWRRLVHLSDIHPARRRFLELYDRMLANELFLESRTWTLDNLKPFDRHSYMGALSDQCTGPEAEIPEDFEMYILEWPARMAVACMWPGLPFVDSPTTSVQRQSGINYLALPPQLSALVFKYQLPESCFIPGLLTWRNSVSTSWLLFDKTPHNQLGFTLHGCVFKIALYPTPHCADEVNDASTIPYDYDDITGTDLYDEMFEGRCLCSSNLHSRLSSPPGIDAEPGCELMDTCTVYSSWVSYLEACWSNCAEPYVDPYSRKIYPVKRFDGMRPDFPLVDLVEEMGKEGYEYLDRSYRDVPAPPWVRRKEAKFQGRLVTGSIPPGSNLRIYMSEVPKSVVDHLD